MAQSGVQQEILELRTRLNRANRAYHVDAAPTMSDREYDEQLARLAALETEHPEAKPASEEHSPESAAN